jgi:CSLREA domain-containing protein
MTDSTKRPGPILPPRWAAVVALLLLVGACTETSAPTAPAGLPVLFLSAESYDLVVNALDDTDDGECNEAHCSLREAVQAVGTGQTIGFSVTGTIEIAETIELPALKVRIAGPGAEVLELDWVGGLGSLIRIPEGAEAIISGLALRGATGGAVRNTGSAQLVDMLIEGQGRGRLQRRRVGSRKDRDP